MYQYLIMISVTSLMFGYLLDNIFQFSVISNSMQHVHVHDSYWQTFLGVLFVVILINAYIYKKSSSKSAINKVDKDTSKSLVLLVDGMTCSHCEANVERGLGSIYGIESIKADHKTGKVIIDASEKLDMIKIKKIIQSYNYDLILDD